MAETLTPEDEARIRARHARVGGFCDYCDPDAWPCDAALALQALDAARAERDALHHANTKLALEVEEAQRERDQLVANKAEIIALCDAILREAT